MLQTQRTGISGTALKLLALVLMLLDHIHYFFEFTGAIPLWFTIAGRLAAPLFLFCTVEGFAHTHDRRRYFLRILLISAGMGLLEFFMQFGGVLNRGDGFVPRNAIFMDFVLLCAVWQGIDWLRARRWLRGIGVIALVLAWPFAAAFLSGIGFAAPVGLLCYTLFPAWSIITDGGWAFLFGGVLLYLLRDNRKCQLMLWAAWTFLTDGVLTYLIARGTPGFTPSMMLTDYLEWFGVFAVVFMALYNGTRGRGFKQLFYWFYPAHVYILYGLSCVAYNLMR